MHSISAEVRVLWYALLHCNKNQELQILQQDDADTASKKKTPVVCIAEAVLIAQPEKA